MNLKYSPTVLTAYKKNPKWWEQNKDILGVYDQDGFDQYGYNSINKDRAGYTSKDYSTAVDIVNGNSVYWLYNEVDGKWTTDPKLGRPLPFETNVVAL